MGATGTSERRKLCCARGFGPCSQTWTPSPLAIWTLHDILGIIARGGRALPEETEDLYDDHGELKSQKTIFQMT